MKQAKKEPIKVQVVEKRKMTPEQIAARKKAEVTNAAEKVFNTNYST